MLQGLFESSTFHGLKQTVAFTEKRHAILAGNIANIDTPEYRSADLSTEDFQSALKDAFEHNDIPYQSQIDIASRLVRPHWGPDQLEPPAGTSASRNSGVSQMQRQSDSKVDEAMKNVLYHDGSDVNIEEQVTKIAKNQTLHNTAVTLLRSQHRILEMAISESVQV